jgi:hypothetical protein
MQARTHRTIEAFDRSVAMLRDYVTRLEAEAASSQNQGKGKS